MRKNTKHSNVKYRGNNTKKVKKLRATVTAMFLLTTIIGSKLLFTYFQTKETSVLLQTANTSSGLSDAGLNSDRVEWVTTTEADGTTQKRVPVPKGFSASQVEGENTVDGGFVVYEIKGDDEGAWTKADMSDLDWDKILERGEQNSGQSNTNSLNSTNSLNKTNATKKNTNTKNTTVANDTANTTDGAETSDESENEKSVESDNTNYDTNDDTKENTANGTKNVTSRAETNKLISDEEQNENNTNVNSNNETSTNTSTEDENNKNDKSDNTVQNEIANENNTEIANDEEIQNIQKQDNAKNINNTKIQNANQNTQLMAAGDGATGDDTTGDETDGDGDSGDDSPTQAEINVFNLQKTHNQFVWVPIDDVTQLYGVDSNGKLWGKLYKYSTNRRSNYNWTESSGIMSITNVKDYREPDVTKYRTNYDIDSKLNNYLYGESQYELLSKEMNQNFYEMIKSIEKYGGFYIGRYETGRATISQTSQAVVRKMNTNIANITWYNSYKGCKNLMGDNENIVTSLISGTLWDATLDWIAPSVAISGNSNKYSGITNSTTWGNYSNSRSNFYYIKSDATEPIETEQLTSNAIIPAGSTEYTNANNIYDLAGNVYEWTLEACSTGNRVCRGGYYYNYGGDFPASYRAYNAPTGNRDLIGSRAYFYIK